MNSTDLYSKQYNISRDSNLKFVSSLKTSIHWLFLASTEFSVCLRPFKLSSECKDGIEEEQHSVDDGQRTLGDGHSPAVGFEAAFPFLQDQHAGRDEHGATEEREEQVQFLADRLPEQVAGEQTN